MTEHTGEPVAQLKEALRVSTAVSGAIRVLEWDQLTKMPPAGITVRAEQLAALEQIAHEKFTDSRIGDLLKRAEDASPAMDPESDDSALLRVVRRDYDRARKMPLDLISESVSTAALAGQVWVEARANNDFKSFAPWLKKNIELSRRKAECLGYLQHPFDALIAEHEPGMTTASVRAIFESLRPHLEALVAKIAPQSHTVDSSVLHRNYDEAGQVTLGRSIAARFGYDFNRGRLDRTVHPFEIAISRDDVRITTRYNPDFLSMSLMGTMHETGHALYELGIGPSLSGTPLSRGVSAGMHESQSRLWENYVGRSRPFWQFFYPQLQAAFPGVLDDVHQEQFYRAVNKVEPSLIRVEADEVTYCLHILLRFELEIALLDGSLKVEDAPEAWNEAMKRSLGITPPNDTMGILQDIHWSSGLAGFQGYALGNIIAAQLWEAIQQAHPDIQAQIAEGEFGTLLHWLRTAIHQHGRKFDPADLIQRATGETLHIAPYVRYLQGKFSEIYSL